MYYKIEKTTKDMLARLPRQAKRPQSPKWQAFVKAIHALEPGQSFLVDQAEFDSNHRNAVSIVQIINDATLRTYIEGRSRRVYRIE